MRYRGFQHRPNPFGQSDQNQSQQPGAGESHNQLPSPFYVQGSQPPRVGPIKKSRVQQNRYAVPSTMHYSESSQAEAGQQIDRIRQLNQPVPSALFNENPEASSSPSNSQNIMPMREDQNNEEMVMHIEGNDDMYQQFINSQLDSAQPGVPATTNPAPSFEDPLVEEVHQDLNEDNYMHENKSNEKEEDFEDDKIGEYGTHEDFNDSAPHSHNFESEVTQERHTSDDLVRPNHQEEMHSESNNIKETNTYDPKVVRRNEQFSPLEKDSHHEYTVKSSMTSRKQSNSSTKAYIERTEEKKRPAHQPFGYDYGVPRSGNFATFIVPSSYSEQTPYISQSSMEGSKLTSALLQMNQSRNSEKNSLNRTDSISSFPVTNYEDSEFMIQAYQRKKKAYEKWKQKLLEVESELHMEKQRAKMYNEENKRYKITLK